MRRGQMYKSKLTSLLVLCTNLNKNISYLFEGTVLVGDDDYSVGDTRTGWIEEQFEEADVRIIY